jgi:hypothetical protein
MLNNHVNDDEYLSLVDNQVGNLYRLIAVGSYLTNYEGKGDDHSAETVKGYIKLFRKRLSRAEGETNSNWSTKTALKPFQVVTMECITWRESALGFFAKTDYWK